MHLLFVAEGLDRSEVGLLARLVGHGHAVDLLVSNPADVFRAEEVGVRACCLPLRRRYDVPAIKALRRRLTSGGVDIVHCLRNNRPITNTLVAIRGTAVPLVAYRGTAGHLSHLDPGSWLSYLSPRISAIVCVSEAVRHYLLGMRVPPRRALTIYKGHDPAWYENEKTADLSEFGIPAGALVVCCAANMRPDKGVDVLVRSLHRLPRDGSVHLLLVGTVQDRRVNVAARDSRIQHLVHFAGYRDDAIRIIGASGVFAMPSTRREGLPRAVIEAMCQRVPPVVTRVGGMPELVQHDQSGLVVAPGDPLAMADAIGRLAADPQTRQNMGQAARERIEAAFSIEQTTEATLSLYKRLCAE